MGSGHTLASEVRAATRPGERVRGLLVGEPLRPGHGLLLEPAAQVHTFGMKFPIDVVFCDRDGVILHVVRTMRPRRVTRWVRGARRALELPAGTVPADVVPGMRLRF